ncbi:MAG: integral membrane sensor protein, partial [Dermatophilaceae bacterium]
MTDSRGIPIWNYELSLDRGGITSPDKFFWSALTDSCWGAYRSWCALALWFLDWVLSFDWLHIVAAPVLTTGDAMQSVVNRIGAAGALLTITAVVAVVWMMRGRWATGIWELSIALVIAALASGVFASPVRMLAGENGVIAQSQQWGLQLSAALADGGGSGGQSADQLRKAQAGRLVDTFIRIPTQMINFGQVLDGGKCESAYTEVVKAGPYGADSTIRDKINRCDPVLGKYAASPSASMALGSLLFMPASVVILLLAIVLSGSVIAAGCSAMYQGLKAIVTLVTGLLPGGGRGSLLLTAAEAVMALVIILFTTVFLGIFLQVIQAVFKSGAGDAVPKTFVIVDVLLLVGVFIYRRQRQRFKEAAARMAEWMAKRPGQGVRPTRLPAQQHGPGLGSTAAGVARSAVSLAQLRAMRARARNTGNTYNLDARRQAVIVEGHPGGGGGGGPVDIGPVDTGPPPTGPGHRPGGGGLKRIPARKD